MKCSFLLFACLAFYACTTPSGDTKKAAAGLANCKSDSINSEFNNAALIYGSTIGEVIQQFYKQGQWKELIKFISHNSITQFGEEEIIKSFQRTDFGYTIKLKSKQQKSYGVVQLNYQTIKFGTKGILRMDTVVENDTAKVIIKGINPSIQF